MISELLDHHGEESVSGKSISVCGSQEQRAEKGTYKKDPVKYTALKDIFQ